MAFAAALTWQAMYLGDASVAKTESAAYLPPLPSTGPGATLPGPNLYTLETAADLRVEASAKRENFRGQAAALSPGEISDEPASPQYQPPALFPEVRPTVIATYGNVGGGVEQWRSLVASIFPASAVDAVLRVMQCESGGNPNATGSAGERGLMQIHPLHFDSTYDPEGNLRAAYRISGGGASFAAWTCKP